MGLTILSVLQATVWSLVCGYSLLYAVGNGAFQAISVLIVLRLHERWKLKNVITRRGLLIALNVSLMLVGVTHFRWMSENVTAWHTGISDGLYTLEAIQQIRDLGFLPAMIVIHSAHLLGHALLLYPVVVVLGMGNFFAITLLNFLAILIATLGVALIMSLVNTRNRHVPVYLFLFHPYSIVLVATIYKDPIIILGTILTFAGLCIQFRLIEGEPAESFPANGTSLLVAGLLLTALPRLAYSFALMGFVGLAILYKSIRTGRIPLSALKPIVGIGAVMAVALLVFARLGVLDPAVGLLTRIYDPQSTTVVLETGDYVRSDNSIAGRFLSGSLTSRLATLPLQIVMQLVSPFPPHLTRLQHVYTWVEEWFGAINLTLAPFLAVGLIGALRARASAMRLIPLFALAIMAPALTFSAVIGRQLAPVVPFLLILAWLGWGKLDRGVTRVIVVASSIMFWIAAFGAYRFLKGA